MSTAATEHLYIEKDPAKYEGKAVIKGTRIPVASIVNHYRSGMSIEEILEGYPSITPAQLFDVLSYYFDNKEEYRQRTRVDGVVIIIAKGKDAKDVSPHIDLLSFKYYNISKLKAPDLQLFLF